MRGLLTLTWVEIKLFMRDPFTAFFSFAFPLLVLIVLGGIFGNTPTEEGFRGAGPIDYYVPGYIGLAIASIGLTGLPVHLATYRERGVLRRFRASAVPAWAVLSAQVIVGVVVATAGSIPLIIAGAVAYDLRPPDSAMGVAAAYAVSSLSFVAVGFLLAALIPSARAAQGAGLLLFFTMMFLSGTDGPRDLMPVWLQRTGDVLPLTYVVTALQDPWLGFGWNMGHLLVLTGAGVVAAALSVRLFRWE